LKLPVAGDEVVCLALYGGSEDQIVLGVGGNAREDRRNTYALGSGLLKR
jgi:hypothetical protein